MELREKAAQLPLDAGVYLFKDALGTILYVGKARSLRSRVRSYFLETRWADAKTGSLVREIADVDYIVVDNEREALALRSDGRTRRPVPWCARSPMWITSSSITSAKLWRSDRMGGREDRFPGARDRRCGLHRRR